MHTSSGRSTLRIGIASAIVGLAVMAAAVSAADIYVSTSATPAAPYDSWATAFTSPQAAFNYAVEGDTIHLAGHAFVGTADGTKVYALTARTNVTVRGGYEADPAKPLPGDRDPATWPTILARGTGTGRVLNLSGLSSVRFEGVTICGGNLNQGGGVNVAASPGGVVFDTCTISNNYANGGHGGAFYIASSTVTLTNSLVTANKSGRGNDGTQAQGGAAHLAASAMLNVYRSTIALNNALSSRIQPSYGGAFFLAAATSELTMRESVVKDNAATTEWNGGTGRGGAIYNNGGKVRLRNVLVARNTTSLTGTDSSSGIMSTGTAASVLLENCTVADNDAGKAGSVALRRSTGVFAVTNSIVWGHVSDLVGFTLAHVAYSDIGDGQNNGLQGCHAVDPRFADTNDYHLQSMAGHYTNGAFGGGSWTVSGTSSPLIDRGDPASPYSMETTPSGNRVNMGAYGNTEVASRTPTVAASLPAVANEGAGFRSHTAALFKGSVTDDGGQLPDVDIHFWETGSATTSTVSVGMREEGPFTFMIGGLASGTAYEYSISASNTAGAAWSGVASFSTLPANAMIHVSPTGDNTDGATWARAFRDPATAFSMAESGDTIRLAGVAFSNTPGFGLNYVYLIDTKSNLRIEGGYQAAGETPGLRDPDQWPTVLKRSSGTASVLKILNASGVIVDGITITGGYNTQGGGVHLSGSSLSVTFAACTITNNLVPAAGLTTDGGAGVFLASGSAVLTNCLIAGNQIVSGGYDNYFGPGGGIRISGGTLTVRNSTIANNVAMGNNKNTAPPYTRGSDGGGIYIAPGAVLDLAESIVTNNRALQGAYPCWTHGGAIANDGGTVRLRNALVARNETVPTVNVPSSGIFSKGTTTLENCTVVFNDSGKTNNFGLTNSVGIAYVSGVLALTNVIVWGHTNDLANVPTNEAGEVRNIAYSMAGTVATGLLQGVNGSLAGDPLFAGGGDYTLQRGSPAVNAGLNLPWMAGALDLAGQARVKGRAVDMGAYEVDSRGIGTVLWVQ